MSDESAPGSAPEVAEAVPPEPVVARPRRVRVFLAAVGDRVRAISTRATARTKQAAIEAARRVTDPLRWNIPLDRATAICFRRMVGTAHHSAALACKENRGTPEGYFAASLGLDGYIRGAPEFGRRRVRITREEFERSRANLSANTLWNVQDPVAAETPVPRYSRLVVSWWGLRCYMRSSRRLRGFDQRHHKHTYAGEE